MSAGPAHCREGPFHDVILGDRVVIQMRQHLLASRAPLVLPEVAMTEIKWNTTGLAEAGFASDLDENFEIARQAW